MAQQERAPAGKPKDSRTSPGGKREPIPTVL